MSSLLELEYYLTVILSVLICAVLISKSCVWEFFVSCLFSLNPLKSLYLKQKSMYLPSPTQKSIPLKNWAFVRLVYFLLHSFWYVICCVPALKVTFLQFCISNLLIIIIYICGFVKTKHSVAVFFQDFSLWLCLLSHIAGVAKEFSYLAFILSCSQQSTRNFTYS